MKRFILLIVLIAPGFLMAQTNDYQLWENAYYQVVKNGATIYYTDVNALDFEYSEATFNKSKANMLEKDGIVKVEFLHFNHTIRVYHFDFIELETIKNFVLNERKNIEVMNRVEYPIEG